MEYEKTSDHSILSVGYDFTLTLRSLIFKKKKTKIVICRFRDKNHVMDAISSISGFHPKIQFSQKLFQCIRQRKTNLVIYELSRFFFQSCEIVQKIRMFKRNIEKQIKIQFSRTAPAMPLHIKSCAMSSTFSETVS